MQQVLYVLSQTTPPNPSDLYIYGPLGVGIVVFSGVIYKLFKIILNDRDKAIQQRDQLLDTYFTKVLPALTENTRVFADVADVLKENTRVLSRHDEGGR